MFGFGVPQLSIILLMVFFTFGISRLPEVGNSFGKAIKNFRKSVEDKDVIEVNPKTDA
ncbi:preprotein translocase subunit SecA [Geobacter sulfurreducens]|nr:preprotein translocase subunit SecA [Geobacter sulfurreducens]